MASINDILLCRLYDCLDGIFKNNNLLLTFGEKAELSELLYSQLLFKHQDAEINVNKEVIELADYSKYGITDFFLPYRNTSRIMYLFSKSVINSTNVTRLLYLLLRTIYVSVIGLFYLMYIYNIDEIYHHNILFFIYIICFFVAVIFVVVLKHRKIK